MKTPFPSTYEKVSAAVWPSSSGHDGENHLPENICESEVCHPLWLLLSMSNFSLCTTERKLEADRVLICGYYCYSSALFGAVSEPSELPIQTAFWRVNLQAAYWGKYFSDAQFGEVHLATKIDRTLRHFNLNRFKTSTAT